MAFPFAALGAALLGAAARQVVKQGAKAVAKQAAKQTPKAPKVSARSVKAREEKWSRKVTEAGRRLEAARQRQYPTDAARQRAVEFHQTRYDNAAGKLDAVYNPAPRVVKLRK